MTTFLIGRAVGEFVTVLPGSKSAAKTTMAETVKVRKERVCVVPRVNLISFKGCFVFVALRFVELQM